MHNPNLPNIQTVLLPTVHTLSQLNMTGTANLQNCWSNIWCVKHGPELYAYCPLSQHFLQLSVLIFLMLAFLYYSIQAIHSSKDSVIVRHSLFLVNFMLVIWLLRSIQMKCLQLPMDISNGPHTLKAMLSPIATDELSSCLNGAWVCLVSRQLMHWVGYGARWKLLW